MILTFENIIGTLISGLNMGAIYAMIALGYTMVYGIAKMLNFAHGDVIMVGTYIVFIFSQKFIGNPFVAILVAVAFCAILGIVIERIAYKPLRGAPSLAVLITAIGVSFLLQSLAQMIFGADKQQVPLFNWVGFDVFGVTIKIETIVTLSVAAVIMIALTLFINKSKTGRAMLAVSEDRGAAQLMGVNVNRTIAITFAIGSGLAAVAGFFMLLNAPNTMPNLGAMPGIKAFVAAVLGGIGSVPGAVLGGIVIGIVEEFAKISGVFSVYSDAIVFSILIIVLLVKPTGLLGKKRNEKV